MSFGSKILEIRLERNLSQEELAERLNVSRLTIHRWENDKSAPNINQVKALCEVLGVSTSYFFEEKEVMGESASVKVADEVGGKTAIKKSEVLAVVISSFAVLLCVALTVFMGFPQESILDRVMQGDGFVEVKRIYVNIPALIVCLFLLTLTVVWFIISLKKLIQNRNNEKYRAFPFS